MKTGNADIINTLQANGSTLMYAPNKDYENENQQSLSQFEVKSQDDLHGYDISSSYTSQNPGITNYCTCTCTCCHFKDIRRSQCILFRTSRYDCDDAIVQETLTSRYSILTAKEFICLKCDRALLAGKFPLELLCRRQKCVYCNYAPEGKIYYFDEKNYSYNDIASQISSKTYCKSPQIICIKCHQNILKHSKEKCSICQEYKKKNILAVFYTDKYPS